jgi:hypothetical protein
MPSAFAMPDLPGYVNDTGNTADHNTQMNASNGGAPAVSADAVAQQTLWIAWGIIIVALAALWGLGYVFK